MLLTAGGRPNRPNTGRKRMALFFCLSAILLALSSRTALLRPIENGLYQYVYQPVRDVVYFPLRMTASGIRHIQESGDLEARTTQLEAENRLLHAQTQMLGHLQAENRRLRMLMDSVLDVRVPVSVAELRDTSIDGYREIITISRGSDDGVYVNQAVIDPYGLVGQVVEVFPDEARVMLISDARSRVPVYVERTQQRTVVVGGASTGVLTLPEMTVGSDIRKDDVLISSGLGGVFPRGYPVARVVAVNRDPRLSFMDIQLEPVARLSSILEVLLLDRAEGRAAENTLPSGPPVPQVNVADGEVTGE
ncbi:rod shape-determining protein MreC [Cardiobacteriaceae bacterium TAE3-ERU3]|nr:rod shape-determining protein MreC [Cardiobacteriaceae bacterium TAE3-ERU3]